MTKTALMSEYQTKSDNRTGGKTQSGLTRRAKLAPMVTSFREGLLSFSDLVDLSHQVGIDDG